MDEYIGAKKNIYAHQNAFGKAVFNADNAIASGLTGEARGAVYTFSRRGKVNYGAYLDEDGSIYMSDKTGIHFVMKREDILLMGDHNVENYLAAVTAVWGYVKPENMLAVARTFSGVAHRIEFIRELDGVRYFNDSIATSPTRTIAGLNSFRQKVILIAGGYDKHIPFEVLAPKVIEKVKYMVLLGHTAQKIKDVVTAHPDYDAVSCPIVMVNTLEEAAKAARRAALAGDIITLSPACASFDMFKNFEIRGNAFKEIINRLK
jgi:UDP-N-acetylmuramoylalanine--D-glutamate ligase